MPAEYRTGDLFAQPDIQAFGHGVNCQGVMGAGIAPLFRKRSEAMYLAYRSACHNGELILGGFVPWLNPDGTVFYNMATQDKPGRNARLGAVESALDGALAHAETHGIKALGIPRIGTGIGGLRWQNVRTVIEKVAAKTPVQVIVVSLPGADRTNATGHAQDRH